ncbi:hypothetical protein WME95_38240 [Sorangium sp. So ce327]|uniref:hypothetical protein n=1 Tax=Sorangium sp. So ce327 TaxID=3133301 RepID=UPI003F60DDFD
MTDLTSLHRATHVAFDARTTERLLQLGATNVVRAADRLIVGPNRRDTLEHARVREELWNSDEKWDRLYSPEVRWKPPVILWASVSLHERVNLWRTCSWLRHLGIQRSDVLIAEFDFVSSTIESSPEPSSVPPFNCSASVAHYPDEVLLDRLDKACPWPAERYDCAIHLWESYAGENPMPFVDSCIAGGEGFPELAPLWAFLSCFFPRKTTEGALLLSRFDELLLTLLSAEWQTPVAVAVHKSQTGMNLWRLLSCTGDLFLGRRLEHWAGHESSAFVERAPGPRPDIPMKSFVYRLTERGMRLRDKGLVQLSDAPRLPVAGTDAYSPSAPWVLLEDGRLAWL